MQEYIEFIEKHIKYFQEHSSLSEQEEVTPMMVNTTLSYYTNVGVALIGEYTRHKRQLYNITKNYTRWHDKLFYDTRKNMISEFESKTIKIAVKEVENAVKVENEDKYWDWQDKINDLEEKISFFRRLIDQWTKLDSVLNNLSRNMRQEMISLSIENRMNKNDKPDTKVRTEFPDARTRTPV